MINPILNIINFLSVMIIVRSVYTQSEINFNLLAKLINSMTNPFFYGIKSKKLEKLFTPVIIFFLYTFFGLLLFLYHKNFGLRNLSYSLVISYLIMIRFLYMFFICVVLLGAIPKNNYFSTFFYRLGNIVVGRLQKVFPYMKKNAVLPTILILTIAYLVISTYLGLIINNTSSDIIILIKNCIFDLISILLKLLTYYSYLLIARAVLSWFFISQYSVLIQFITFVTDPIIYFCRKFIPPIGIVDFSVIAAYLILRMIKYFLIFIVGLL